jgi:hypothetical protein
VLGTLLAHYRFTLARKKQERPVMRNLAMGPKGRVRLTVMPRRLPASRATGGDDDPWPRSR